MTLFQGHYLKSQFIKKLPADFAGATNIATSIFVGTLTASFTQLYISNSLTDGTDGIDIGIALKSPESDDTIPLQFWLEVPGIQVLNFSLGSNPRAIFEARTKFYAYYIGASAPTQGSLRIFGW